jgi:hypothetical protein
MSFGLGLEVIRGHRTLLECFFLLIFKNSLCKNKVLIPSFKAMQPGMKCAPVSKLQNEALLADKISQSDQLQLNVPLAGH